ncbi:TetR/AcrR family transcriptional regulator [Frankia nepalensis]|uniref:TetR/AcrR family transcriptional regulator n=1 Tax=Frankia nepalensis TaxID=1836974 RepID=A0A937RJ06_9ACTN|nr:TetR/AcrR family transcriptional regulator [Frankia nepalensis]MBL7633156.1 TetR/AcrR family transcriptional regulator [Frankia nepalensis]
MPYHHGNLREALIAAATQLAAEHGPDAVVLREAARRVGVSHNAAYRHFADRDALLRAVSARAMTEFGQLMATRIAGSATGHDKDAAAARFEASGRAYVEFATTHPGLFRMACAWSLGDVAPDAAVNHPYAQLSERLDELVSTGVITPARRQNAEIAAWSAVHGFAMLVLDGPLSVVPPDERERGLAEVLRVVREGI